MLFNSTSYLLFFTLFFIFYWYIFREKKKKNFLILISSYLFYSFWDWRFLFLLLFSTLLDFYTGHKIFKSKSVSDKKKWLIISMVINLGLLGVFKYYNFFVESFSDLLKTIGFTINPRTLNIVLPVGISFYTFHGISYILDIYKNKITPEKEFSNYAVFVSFFPLLVAGPIERASHLLPQINNERKFELSNAISGLKQILWGLFKKVVIADTCALYSDTIFNNLYEFNGVSLFFGAILFSFQIYGDFSGYSDIASGSARLLGFELIKNFNFPYFSKNLGEFWKKWHISLSSWFRDYVYIPLGGNKIKQIRNVVIIFILSGFWHGANWTFIFWGGVNAIFVIISMKIGNYIHKLNLDKNRFINLFRISTTFVLTSLIWVLFRSENLAKAIYFYLKVKSDLFHFANYKETLFFINEKSLHNLIFLITFFMTVEYFGRSNNFALEKINLKSKYLTKIFYYSIVSIVIYFLYSIEYKPNFIYFQF